MPKSLSIQQVKNLSPKTLLKIIQRAKDYLKTNDVFIEMCKDHNVDVGFVDFVPVKFGDLEVSARTAKGIITLGWKLLADGQFFNNIHYLQHELTHYCQQCYGDAATQGADEGDYLENPAEQEGFQRQIEYIDDQFGEKPAEDYVDNLLDHHNVNDADEREDKKDTLMERVSQFGSSLREVNE